MCKGLPGSGKSTWAKQGEADYGWVRVNKDEIRIELGMDRKSYKREQEYAVLDRRDRLINEALAAGKTVVSDDTNYAPKHEARLRELAKKHKAEFKIQDFSEISIETCIERDAQRQEGQRVGRDVILGMAKQYLGYNPYVPDTSLPVAILCDLDGTLALFTGLRGAFDYDKCDKDKVNEPVYRIISLFATHGYKIVYMSGREDWARFKTEDFLATNNCPPGPLFMRSSGDFRKDFIIKRELFDQYVRNSYNVKFVLDDRNQVVKMWRDLGLTCLQVADGAF